MSSIELPSPTRRIELEGCYNLRDTGGYATSDGHVTRWGTLFRADGLHRLPQASQDKLLAQAVRTIIDLRRPTELQESPNVFAQSGAVKYLNISLIVEEVVGSRTTVTEVPDLAEINRRILDNSQAQIKQVMQTLATPDAFPVLIHCTVGKDRTGLVIALLLALANVPDETIAEDYALSAEYLSPLFEELRQRVAQAGQDVSQFEKLLVSPPELMLETLSYLKANYGNARAYLSGLGLSEIELNTLHDRLVE